MTEGHHDVAVVDETGRVVCKERFGVEVAGFRRLAEAMDELRPDGLRGLPIASGTAQGLLVSALRAAEARGVHD